MARGIASALLVVATLLPVEMAMADKLPKPTERLDFAPLTLDDATLLDALNRAPGVMRYLDRVPPTQENLVTHIIPDLLHIASTHSGYGMWLAYQHESRACVGWFKLEPGTPGAGDAEIGYRLFPDYWGSGLATEGARELMRYAFEELGANRVIAQTMAVNTPSRKVMERIGLRYVRTFHQEFDDPLPGTEHGEVEYALTREEWLLRRP